MKRLTAVSLGFLALVLAGGGSTAAADGYGPWEPTYQGAITAPAGVVCPFTVTAAPVYEKLLIRNHYDAAGNNDGYQVTGPLIAQITNTENGASVRRDLSGLGTVTFNPDGSYDGVADGNFLVFFRAADTPSHQLLLMSGETLLHGDASGAKTLVSTTGRTEDLCTTLA